MKDIVVSILARLKNQAKETGLSYQMCLQLFCQEEFLRRLWDLTTNSARMYIELVLSTIRSIYCYTQGSNYTFLRFVKNKKWLEEKVPTNIKL